MDVSGWFHATATLRQGERAPSPIIYDTAPDENHILSSSSQPVTIMTELPSSQMSLMTCTTESPYRISLYKGV